MSALPVEEPSASFLAASRMRLQEALEQVQPHRAWYQRFAFDPAAWLRQVRFSPALAMVDLHGWFWRRTGRDVQVHAAHAIPAG